MSHRPSAVERAKEASRGLRGSLAAALDDPDPRLPTDDRQVVKFHGIYQQEDRDARRTARITGEGRQYNFMVRVKIPAGRLTAEQYLAMDALAEDVVYNRSLRVTTRQNFQLHGVLKSDLRAAIRHIDEALLSTLSGCGDVERNIVAPPAPIEGTGHRALAELAQELTEALTPMTQAYREVWFDGEPVASGVEHEPLYGRTYLPRKFKTGLALPDDNSTDVFDQDAGLIAVVRDGEVAGFNLAVGGSSGMTHRKERTFVRLATPLGYVDRAAVVDAVRTVIEIFRDHGDRGDRQHARLKYLVEEWGIDRFRQEFEERLPNRLAPWVPVGPLRHRDWLGRHSQGDGRWLYGVHVPNGRIQDDATSRIKSAIRTIAASLAPGVVLTPQQNVLFTDLAPEALDDVESILETYRVVPPERLSPVRRHALACPALPTCGLALAESERVVADVLGELERAVAARDAAHIPVTVRMTGCPNGCARPYNADVGIVGRAMGRYDIFVGGHLAGERLAERYAEDVPLEDIATALAPLLDRWASERLDGEGLGDFYDRAIRARGRRDLLRAGGSAAVVADVDDARVATA